MKREIYLKGRVASPSRLIRGRPTTTHPTGALLHVQTTYKPSSFACYGGQVGRFEDKYEWEI
ncbi:MAG: hypothetical protein ACK46A_06730 [Akkermansiaceae bacterium]|jgi:hypothetical protein